MLIPPCSESSDEHVHSLMEIELLQMDTIPLLVEDIVSQIRSDESDIEDYDDTTRGLRLKMLLMT
ncbi:660_t:CDS:2 [Dentiscutata erythropus]|uniref:660_t:CDS:1 n=1 Tax=Dentiscutata erythropus TaxID=1348616 RepID=A0A9N9N912_9GLOM|nr:660_t:CDS:2 [Dentiscutata erythropus]